MANYDSNYAIAQEISARIGTTPVPFDSVYSICLAIYQELGGTEENFDSVYSILLEILPLATEAANVIDDTIVSTVKTWSSERINSELSGKQDSLTAGTGISISGDTISCTVPTLTAGQNITISGDTISADGYVWNSANGGFTEKYKQDTDDGGQIVNNTASGLSSHAEGYNTTASGDYGAHAEGYLTIASGAVSHAEGYMTTASGNYGAHAEGNKTNAFGKYSHAEGSKTTASGLTSHAEGNDTIASGRWSHAEGYQTTASHDVCHAEGCMTTASNYYGHAEGCQTFASAPMTHAEGCRTTAAGEASHAEGWGSQALGYNTASGTGSHVEGIVTQALNIAEHAEGYYNVSHRVTGDGTAWNQSSGNTIHSIGIGNFSGNRKNALEVMQNGDLYIKGIGGYQGTDTKTQDATIQTLQEYIASLEARIEELEPLPAYPPINQVWYTTASGNTVSLGIATTVGESSNPISNVYKKGKGIMTFDSEIIDLGDFAALDEDNYITALWLPYLYEYEYEGQKLLNEGCFKNICTGQEYLTDVYYPGTVDELTDLFEGYGAMLNAGTNVIHCSDGDFTVPVGS